MENEPESLAAWIQRRRLERRWSQARLAHEMGVVPNSVLRWEAGAPLRLANYQRLLQVLADPEDQPPEIVNEASERGDRIDEVLAGQRAILERIDELRDEVSELRGARRGGEPRELPNPDVTAAGMAEVERLKPKPPGARRRSRRADRPDTSPNHGSSP